MNDNINESIAKLTKQLSRVVKKFKNTNNYGSNSREITAAIKGNSVTSQVIKISDFSNVEKVKSMTNIKLNILPIRGDRIKVLVPLYLMKSLMIVMRKENIVQLLPVFHLQMILYLVLKARFHIKRIPCHVISYIINVRKIH